MKTFLRFYFVFSLIVILFSCSDNDSDADFQESSPVNLTVFTNQTGNANADALQAQYIDAEGTLNFYGDFDAVGNPTRIKTLTYQKVANDTIVNLKFDPDTSLLTTAFTTVNGVNSDLVLKFDYPNETTMSVSFHDYNWLNNSSELIYSLNVETPFNNLLQRNDILWGIGSVLAAVVIVEVGMVAIAVGTALISSISASFVRMPVGTTAAVLSVLNVIIPSDAFSAEQTPQDIPYPDDTPADNPINESNDPTDDLVNPCEESELKVTLAVDSDNVLVAFVNSVEPGDYTFEWSTGEIDSQPVSDSIVVTEEGFYTVVVTDSNGCNAYASVTIETPVDQNSIFGNWTIAASDCDGTDIEYTGPFSLNSDFTVTQEDDSNGNYITNSFTFENNVLSFLVEYMDPVCNGDESRFQRDTATLTYNSATDSFSGTGTTVKVEIDVPGCEVPPFSCTYDITLTR